MCRILRSQSRKSGKRSSDLPSCFLSKKKKKSMPLTAFLKLYHFSLHNSLGPSEHWEAPGRIDQGECLESPTTIRNGYRCAGKCRSKRTERKRMAALFPHGFLLPTPAFCETPRSSSELLLFAARCQKLMGKFL